VFSKRAKGGASNLYVSAGQSIFQSGVYFACQVKISFVGGFTIGLSFNGGYCGTFDTGKIIALIFLLRFFGRRKTGGIASNITKVTRLKIIFS
jgi:hypothetical protein